MAVSVHTLFDENKMNRWNLHSDKGVVKVKIIDIVDPECLSALMEIDFWKISKI
jgi:hypothetical protein